MDFLFAPRFRCPAFAVALLVATCVGCSTDALKKPSGEESFSDAARFERPTQRGLSAPFAVTSRARQIEDDLGVR
jgi:hypothetical protein